MSFPRKEEQVEAINANVIPIQTSKTLYAIGLAESGELCPVVRFDSDKPAESALLGHVEADDGSSTVLLKGLLFVIGGGMGRGGEFPKRVSTFNVTTGEKGRVADLEIGRDATHSVAASSDEVFVCGGFNYGGGRLLNSCEAFRPGRSGWRRLPNLLEARGGLALVFLPDGRLLATGGVGGGFRGLFVDAFLSSCELLNTASQSEGWRAVAEMQQTRCGHGAVYFEGLVFVAGGPTSCEVFKPPSLDSTTEIGQWTRISSEMTRKFTRIQSTVVISADEMLVFGVVWGTGVNLTGEVERFKRNSTSFSEIGDFGGWSWTPLPRIGHLQGGRVIGVHPAN